MNERIRFVLKWEELWEEREGYVNVAALCREFGVSRSCGYKWIRRYVEAGRRVEAMHERSRRPRRSPNKTEPIVVDAIIRARKMHPRWGPVTLRAWLAKKFEQQDWPAVSTIAKILEQHGMTTKRRRRPKVAPHTEPLAHADGPNVVWTADFKGHFRTEDGTTVYPLTMQDPYSRFLLRCEGLERPRGGPVIDVFRSAFKEFGMPGAIRTDNGPPFASVGPGGLTELSVWFQKLGVAHERIEPGHPEQNGRHERMHRTLKAATCNPPKATLRAQQRAFDKFRRCFNQERPHQALKGQTPDESYVPSARQFPKKIQRMTYPFAEELRTVDKKGKILWRRKKIHVGEALRNELVALEPTASGRWSIYFGETLLGFVDTKKKGSKLIRPRRQWKKV